MIGTLALAGGVTLVWAGAVAVVDDAALRAIAVVVGLAVAYLGIDRLLRGIVGRRVPTDLWLSVFWLAVLALAAILADWLPFTEARNSTLTFGEPISRPPDLFSEHPFGTDPFGLDLLGGVVYGARVSLQISFGAVAIGFVLGGLIGILAGMLRGKFDAAVGVVTDALLAFPPLILLIGLMIAVEPSVLSLSATLAFLSVPTFIRLARANTLVFAKREFVSAAVGIGATRRRIIFRELAPNVALPLISYAFIVLAVLVVAEGSLSFLGLSIQRPEPTWGNMISGGSRDIDRSPHLVLVPATVMFLTVFALNRVGDSARKAWDPRESKLD